MSVIKTPYIMIKKRPDFLAANRGRRFATRSFVLLVYDRHDGDNQKRLGITVTKKIGNAVVRNRMKRRFRELARECFNDAKAGSDHILIGRMGGIERDYNIIRDELYGALRKIAKKTKQHRDPSGISMAAPHKCDAHESDSGQSSDKCENLGISKAQIPPINKV